MVVRCADRQDADVVCGKDRKEFPEGWECEGEFIPRQEGDGHAGGVDNGRLDASGLGHRPSRNRQNVLVVRTANNNNSKRPVRHENVEKGSTQWSRITR